MPAEYVECPPGTLVEYGDLVLADNRWRWTPAELTVGEPCASGVRLARPRSAAAESAPQLEAPEPYSEISADAEGLAGDLISAPGMRGWQELDATSAAQPISRGTRRARLIPPAGHTLVRGGTIGAYDLVWQSPDEQWLERAERVGRDVLPLSWRGGEREVREYVARPSDAQLAGRMAAKGGNLPPRTRLLYLGETTRRGDLMTHDELPAWREVDAEIGHLIAGGDPFCGNLRFCRPVAASFQTWYVDLRLGQGTGNDKYEGSRDRPFATLEGARQAIEKRFAKAKQNPCGLLVECRGAPLFAYDLPEPPPRETVAEAAPQQAAAAAAAPAEWDPAPVVDAAGRVRGPATASSRSLELRKLCFAAEESLTAALRDVQRLQRELSAPSSPSSGQPIFP